MAKILIVDDKETNLLALEKVFKGLAVEIVKALNGEEALRASLNHDFAMAILDVQMPVMDGFELATLLRCDPSTRDIPIIFLTAVYSTEPYIFRGYASGAVDYITKPFSPDLLLSKVRVFLELYQQKKALMLKNDQYERLVRTLKTQIDQRKKVEQRLHQANETLEEKVKARTADLDRTITALKDSNAKLVSRSDQLKTLAAELTMAEHRERHRIARVLHDGLQQHLVIAKLQLEMLALGPASDDTKAAATEIGRLIGESIDMSRSLSAEISPPVLHKKGLFAGFKWLARWMTDKHGLNVDLAVDANPELQEDIKILVFESVREMLLNTVKHAGVSSAQLSLRQIDDAGIQVRVSDEGRGFDITRLDAAATLGSGHGLFSIRERIGLVGGCLHIDSCIGKGCCFTLTVPCWISARTSLQNDKKFMYI